MAVAELEATVMEVHSSAESGSVKQYVSLSSVTFIMNSNFTVFVSAVFV